MSRKTNKVAGGDTGRIEQHNDLRTEARKSSQFTPFQQEVPDLTLFINEGKVFFVNTLREFAGGDSPSFTAPVTHPRIDLLVLKSDGTLERIAGEEAASPVAPTIPLDKYPICQVYNRVGQTSIKEEDDSTNGYIQKDLRAEVGYIKDVAQNSKVDTLNAQSVKKTGNQTIAGIKTFSSIPLLPASNPTTANQATRKAFVEGAVDTALDSYSNEIGSRALNAIYRNTTGKTMIVLISIQSWSGNAAGASGKFPFEARIGSETPPAEQILNFNVVYPQHNEMDPQNGGTQTTLIIPDDYYYTVIGTKRNAGGGLTLSNWIEITS